MRYISTRGTAPALDFEAVLLAGLARDGGLYVPESWPVISAADLRRFAGLSYAEVAVEVMLPFLGGSITRADFARMVGAAYATFSHHSVAPLVQLGPNRWLMELFHGPTLAFKDVALQLLGQLFDHVLRKNGQRTTIVGATSGDTGSAAIEACRGREAIDIFIMHPHGRTSDIQRRQMTTVADPNVHNIAVDGTFDDCQNLVKALFNDQPFRDGWNLSAVNSINWARVMAQIVYYVTAAAALGATQERPIAFSVPTGNFGDVYAGYGAARMGVPIQQLLVATNRNDILARFFATGEYRMAGVHPTISPSMDIEISSNFERLLFDLCDRDGRATAGLMDELKTAKSFRLSANQMDRARELFSAGRAGEEQTAAQIAQTRHETGLIVDPHTAVGLHVAASLGDAAVPLVSLATAHPGKFAAAVEAAIGRPLALPPRLAALDGLPERYATLPNDFATIRAYIMDRARR